MRRVAAAARGLVRGGAGRRRSDPLHQQSLDHPPVADAVQAGRRSVHHRQRFRRRRPCGGARARRSVPAHYRPRSPVGERRHDQPDRPRHRPRRRASLALGQRISRHRDRGRTYRFRTPRFDRGCDPRPAAQIAQPRLDRTRRLRPRHRPDPPDPRGDGRPSGHGRGRCDTLDTRDGGQGQPGRRCRRSLLPLARQRGGRYRPGAGRVRRRRDRRRARLSPAFAMPGRKGTRSRAAAFPQPGLFGAAAAFAKQHLETVS